MSRFHTNSICLACFVVGIQFCHSAEPEIVGPWNLTQLKQPPTMRWLSQNGPVHSLIYSGEKYQGQSTEVFAFYASPATLDKANANGKYPGVVLIHGGGGTAFAEWAWLWAKRGYAAIAMDLAGCQPSDPIYDASGVPLPNQAAKPETRTRLANGGPGQGPAEKFDSIGGDHTDDWPYHAAASVIRAHSLLRSFPEVIADRTAVTGISWGGYTTCLVASLDDRFRAAVPVYGCGYLFDGESVQKPSIDKLNDRRAAWIKTYDPSSLLARCRVPILFVNGTNDIHYPLDSYQKSFSLVPGQKQMRIEVNMRHGHPPGWAPQEIGLFIDSYCRQGQPLPLLGEPVLTLDTIQTAYTSTVPLKSAKLHFTSDTGLRSSRTWQSLPAEITPVTIRCTQPPPNANTWFISVTDDRGALVTSSVQFSSESKTTNPAKALETPRPSPRLEDLGRAPLNSYGSLESTIENLRAHRPLDLNAATWRRDHPTASHEQWAREARKLLADGLHYDSGKLELNAATTARWETDSFVRETIEFNTTPWFRVPGYFYVPKNVPLPAPALVVFHEWGGPLLFGADRISGEPIHPAITEHRQRNSGGRPLADWFASHGYAVIVIDAYHFGRRAPRGLGGLPNNYDPATLDDATLKKYDSLVRDTLYLGVRQLNWAGTTWAGVNYGDDSRCIDYLLSRKEVDPNRIGCTGLSGGGWRTNIMAALEPRIKAAVAVGWMTTGDTQQPYNINGAIGTFCLLPGIWNRLDIPDLISMAAPKAVMVVSGTKDRLFPPLGQREAARQIADAYEWAKCPERFRDYAPDKEHCYDAEIQEEALAWFDAHLKRQPPPAGSQP